MERWELRRIGGKFESLGITAKKMSDPRDQFYKRAKKEKFTASQNLCI